MTDNIPDLIAEAREWASGSPLGKITAREVDKGILFARRLADALEAEHKQAEGLLVDLDARFEHSDHTAAKYYRRRREAERELSKAGAERDRYGTAIAEIRALLPGPRTFAESLSRDHAGNLWPRTIDADRVATILARALNENGETDDQS